MAARRIADEPGYVLHHYDWSESSLILETFTRHHGRVALVAKGVKRPTSNFRPVLLPLQPLRLTWTVSAGEGADIHALKGAEWAGGHVMSTGAALLAGYHANELLIRLLAREDAHPALFDAYAATVRALAVGASLAPVLRAFELLLLRELGLLPALDVETATLTPLADAARYVLAPEAGVRAAEPGDAQAIAGAHWRALEGALGGVLDTAGPARAAALAQAAAPVAAALMPPLRALLQHHVGGPLRTRQLLRELQQL